MKKFLFAAPLAMVCVAAAHSQAVSVNGGAIQGTITDPSGASVARAEINITSVEEGTSKTITTDKAGFYSIGPLNPGEYKVTVSAPGFSRLEVTTRILTGTATPGSFKLTVGQESQTVEVTAGDIQVNTDQTGVSDVITREQVENLPVNGRNFLDLAQIEPGVQLQNGTAFDPTKAGYTGISVNGVSGRTTRIILDGSDITDETVGTTIFNVSQGAVNEFQLNRSTQDVSGEVTSQGQVLVSTRSGTNAFHGQGFYQFQDQRALYANPNYTAPFTPPYFQRNQYGGSFGGPILKDKLFFFGNAERIQQLNGAPANLGTIFNATAITTQYPNISAPYHQTYSTLRLDAQGPLGGHYFARGNYNVDSSVTGTYYSVYQNRDNTYGLAFGADFSHGRLTHSFRGGYEKFHNLITDATGSGGYYNPLNSQVGATYASQITFGPNSLAPQITFQSDKQLRYDGGYTLGAHNIRFGGAMNRVLEGSYFAPYKLAPRVTLNANALLGGTVTSNNPNARGCNGATGAGVATCASDPVNGYNITGGFTFANGLGYSSEIPGFNQPYGAFTAWRASGYISDSWKVTPSLGMQVGLRWSIDTNRENNDIDQPTCAAYVSGAFSTAAAKYICNGLPTTTTLSSLWDPSLTGRVKQPTRNFGPQIGLNYAPGNHKTSLRSGFGVFYENVVFNSTGNSRSIALPVSYAYSTIGTVCSAYSINYPDGTVATTTPDGQDLQTWCKNSTVTQATPQILAIASKYQSLVTPAKNEVYLANRLSGAGAFGQNFKTPYSLQWNFGIQRELWKGAVISGDYVHNTALRIGQAIELNHIGAARTFNAAYGLAAINRLAATTTPVCAQAATVAAAQATVNCIIANGLTAAHTPVTINNFAGQGLDTAANYDSSTNWRYAKGDPTAANATAAAKQNTPAAFPGLNPDLGSGAFIRPTGRSGYDALQVVYRQSSSKPLPGIDHGNFQISYNLSRIVSNSTSSDEFFGTGVYDKDNPNQYIGRNSLDRKHQLSFGGSFTFKYGPQLGVIGHFFSALPSNLTLDSGIGNGALFQTDITGDGTTSDIAPGTLPGDYMHRVNGSNLNNYITNFNGAYAGKLTPAGQAVVNSGLMNVAQLTALKGVIQPVSMAPTNISPNNPMFRSFDANFAYPLPFTKKLHEGLEVIPGIAFYNVGNLSNFSTYTGTLQNTTTAASTSNPSGTYNVNSTGNGFVNGNNAFAVNSTKRTLRGAGTFSQGAPRQAEFTLKVNF